ncbi:MULTISPECIES: hypothetical protein [unclassified Tolypothrix]|uniref:hypothetical protein n=1 Tax=unclassified Tolypothrix TaxID=2649714 RepID=UPI0005EAAC67|nr:MULTISPECIES: hypothetical protein [unclassified Tolypothrix]BAY93085.1 O-antigen polymerase [Microchaete diplosiphon NIES-3275]EKF00331.1 hypothetical protein FDUTEX481_08992 [Tolypothrix sp. PCC 7601]MBE9081894.1 hypothetical protein [Tolypothrix sp. LEGE 11397]UYD26964.1 hypothetical protein HGR01_02320 [Tolypothrix sp. PCC 7712]UYD37177.1 hypothetical protein HG267_16470 [Tolypothrix sp. PCC 7601]
MKRHLSLNAFSSRIDSYNDKLFRGVLIRWELLTQAEKVVSQGIILIPLWWLIGWAIMPFIWVIGIVIYEYKNYKKIRLSRPSVEVIAILLFTVNSIISFIVNSPQIYPRGLIFPFYMWGCGGLLLWYIQSHKIRIRLQVVAWAFSIAICMMLVWWLLFYFILNEPYFIPTRTLYATILDKGARYNPNDISSVSNFLVPYNSAERGFGGLYRYTFFFTHPTVSSFAIGFAGLIVLDTKKRLWYLPIITVCSFLILICQARNAWLVLPIILILRWLFINSKTKEIAFILTLLSIISFVSLSIPSVTNWINETNSNTVEVTSNFRKDSTETRNLIYQRTWQSIVEEPSLIGHGLNGASVQPGFEFAVVGTESFILGTLLYKSGFLGTGLFITFLFAFLRWFYKTRENRPICSFLILLYFGLTSLVTEFEIPVVIMTLLSSMLFNPSQITSKK